MGLFNISLHWPIKSHDKAGLISWREGSKKHALSLIEGFVIPPAQSQGRQDALFHGQGRSQCDARSVLTVREHGNLARTPLVDPSA